MANLDAPAAVTAGTRFVRSTVVNIGGRVMRKEYRRGEDGVMYHSLSPMPANYSVRPTGLIVEDRAFG